MRNITGILIALAVGTSGAADESPDAGPTAHPFRLGSVPSTGGLPGLGGLDLSQSFSLSFAGGSGGTIQQGMLTNTLAFQPAANLDVRVHLDLVHTSGSYLPAGGAQGLEQERGWRGYCGC